MYVFKSMLLTFLEILVVFIERVISRIRNLRALITIIGERQTDVNSGTAKHRIGGARGRRVTDLVRLRVQNLPR